MNFLVTICARGGSKGIPGKNIRQMNGKPLIAYSIETARKFLAQHNGDLALSTDDDDIKAKAAEFGLNTDYTRPDQHATDSAGKIGVIKHLKEYEEATRGVEYDFVLDLDVTSPLRTIQDLNEAFDLLCSNEKAYNVFSVSPANRNPYFNMVEEREDGFVQVVKNAGEVLSRQAAPEVYDMNASFYIYRPSFFNEGLTSAITNRSLAYVVPHSCFDLDHPEDFTVMELMLQNNLFDFEL